MRSQQLLEHKTKIGRQPELSGQEEGFEKFASDQIYVFQPRMCVISHLCISLIVEEKKLSDVHRLSALRRNSQGLWGNGRWPVST